MGRLVHSADVTHEDLSLCNKYISSVMSVYLYIEQEVRSDLRWSQDEGENTFKVACELMMGSLRTEGKTSQSVSQDAPVCLRPNAGEV